MSGPSRSSLGGGGDTGGGGEGGGGDGGGGPAMRPESTSALPIEFSQYVLFDLCFMAVRGWDHSEEVATREEAGRWRRG